MVFALLLFLISMSIYSNIFTLIGTSFAERLLFLPSLGFCLLTGILILKIPGNKPSDPSDLGTKAIFLKNPLIWTITGIILLLFSMKTLSRNAEWKDEITLISADVKRSPNSAHMRYYNGIALSKKALETEDQQDYNDIIKQSINEFRACVTILPSFTEGYEQLGLAYYRIKDSAEALRNYEKAIQLNSGRAVTYSNMGIIFFEKKDYTKAFELYQKAVSLDTNFADGYFNLGSMYGMQGKYELAIENFQKAIRLNPANAQAHYFLGMTFQTLNKPDLAKEYLVRAGQLDPAYKK